MELKRLSLQPERQWKVFENRLARFIALLLASLQCIQRCDGLRISDFHVGTRFHLYASPIARNRVSKMSLTRQLPNKSSGVTVDSAIDAATKKDWKSASSIFRRSCSNAETLPKVRDCNKFIRILGDSGKLEEAVDAFKFMIKAGLLPTIVTYSTLISRSGAAGNTVLAEQFYKDMIQIGIKPDTQAMNSLINAFAKVGAIERAMEVFDQMKLSGVRPTIITFNSLLDACARAKQTDRAREVFLMIREWQLEPNERTYSILIQSHVTSGDLQGAFDAFNDMKDAGIKPNTFTYSTLINGCSRTNQLEKAFDTLREMTEQGLEPNVVTWTTLIHASTKNNHLETGFRLFREMMIRGVPPNGVTCSALMDGCLKHGEVDLAFQVLQYMLDTGLEPTKVTYTSLLSECARLERADRAAQVLKQMREMQSQNAITAIHNSIVGDIGENLEKNLLKLFGEARKVDEAVTVLESMISRREFPDSNSWNMLFDAVETGHQFEHAMNLLESMREKGQHLPINEITYGALLGASARVNKLMRALVLVKDMKDSGVTPTEDMFQNLIELCRHQRQGRAAVDVFEAMRNSGVSPGVKTYTSLLKAISDDNTHRSRQMKNEIYANKNMSTIATKGDDDVYSVIKDNNSSKDMEKSEGTCSGNNYNSNLPTPSAAADNLFRVFLVFGEMKSNGVHPDVPAYNALINSCAAVGDLERAMAVLRQMYDDENCSLPDAITFTSLIKTAANANNADAAEEIFAAMQQRTNHFTSFHRPSEKTFKHIMNANINVGRYSRVLELWDDMLNQGILPSRHTASAALVSCRQLNDFNEGVKVYKVISNANIRLDNFALLSIVKLCEESGHVDLARDIMRNRSSK